MVGSSSASCPTTPAWTFATEKNPQHHISISYPTSSSHANQTPRACPIVPRASMMDSATSCEDDLTHQLELNAEKKRRMQSIKSSRRFRERKKLQFATIERDICHTKLSVVDLLKQLERGREERRRLEAGILDDTVQHGSSSRGGLSISQLVLSDQEVEEASRERPMEGCHVSVAEIEAEFYGMIMCNPYGLSERNFVQMVRDFGQYAGCFLVRTSDFIVEVIRRGELLGLWKENECATIGMNEEDAVRFREAVYARTRCNEIYMRGDKCLSGWFIPVCCGECATVLVVEFFFTGSNV